MKNERNNREESDREESVTGELHTVSYVADAQGEQQLIPGSVWQPVNVVNRRAWEEIEQHVAVSKEKITQGRVSCLHYYMIANQMDIGLLAKYTGQARCLVRLHLLPFIFCRLGRKTLERYAQVFLVSPEDLIQGILKAPVYNRQ
ncbi:MAG: hypothetical protein D3914_05175 [Candidatus Electrothrix sp. LOE2]|nr:hypothetical protein [Candidatus Electrothrix sp. LOE2]